jgi:hypothetical protein
MAKKYKFPGMRDGDLNKMFGRMRDCARGYERQYDPALRALMPALAGQLLAAAGDKERVVAELPKLQAELSRKATAWSGDGQFGLTPQAVSLLRDGMDPYFEVLRGAVESGRVETNTAVKKVTSQPPRRTNTEDTPHATLREFPGFSGSYERVGAAWRLHYHTSKFFVKNGDQNTLNKLQIGRDEMQRLLDKGFLRVGEITISLVPSNSSLHPGATFAYIKREQKQIGRIAVLSNASPMCLGFEFSEENDNPEVERFPGYEPLCEGTYLGRTPVQWHMKSESVERWGKHGITPELLQRLLEGNFVEDAQSGSFIMLIEVDDEPCKGCTLDRFPAGAHFGTIEGNDLACKIVALNNHLGNATDKVHLGISVEEDREKKPEIDKDSDDIPIDHLEDDIRSWDGCTYQFGPPPDKEWPTGVDYHVIRIFFTTGDLPDGLEFEKTCAGEVNECRHGDEAGYIVKVDADGSRTRVARLIGHFYANYPKCKLRCFEIHACDEPVASPDEASADPDLDQEEACASNSDHLDPEDLLWAAACLNGTLRRPDDECTHAPCAKRTENLAARWAVRLANLGDGFGKFVSYGEKRCLLHHPDDISCAASMVTCDLTTRMMFPGTDTCEMDAEWISLQRHEQWRTGEIIGTVKIGDELYEVYLAALGGGELPEFVIVPEGHQFKEPASDAERLQGLPKVEVPYWEQDDHVRHESQTIGVFKDSEGQQIFRVYSFIKPGEDGLEGQMHFRVGYSRNEGYRIPRRLFTDLLDKAIPLDQFEATIKRLSEVMEHAEKIAESTCPHPGWAGFATELEHMSACARGFWDRPASCPEQRDCNVRTESLAQLEQQAKLWQTRLRKIRALGENAEEDIVDTVDKYQMHNLSWATNLYPYDRKMILEDIVAFHKNPEHQFVVPGVTVVPASEWRIGQKIASIAVDKDVFMAIRKKLPIPTQGSRPAKADVILVNIDEDDTHHLMMVAKGFAFHPNFDTSDIEE